MFTTLFNKTKKFFDSEDVSKTSEQEIQRELVEEIHDTFNSAPEEILFRAENFINEIKETLANIEKENESNVELIKKFERMNNIGFTSSLKEDRDKINALKEKEIRLNKRTEKNKKTIELVNYYSQKYPLYKFITEEMVDEICKKYGLYDGSSDKYIGDIPEKNLKEIENFVNTNYVNEEDLLYKIIKSPYHLGMTSSISYENYSSIKSYEELYKNGLFTIYKNCFDIIAPLKDFDLENSDIINNKIVNKVKDDPIVTRRVIGGRLVISAWGLEASDPNVMNPNMN